MTKVLIPILEIIWIDVILSGDNAIVVALACGRLPKELRLKGIVLGTTAAISLRVFFTVGFVRLLGLPFINLIGGLLLLWIAVNFAGEDHQNRTVQQSTSLLGAVRVIVLADVAMSLDNVIAIAAASKGSTSLIVFGIILSISPIIVGSRLALVLLTRFPALVWVSVALLGFIAGEMIGDEFSLGRTQLPNLDLEHVAYLSPVCGAVAVAFVMIFGLLLRQRERGKIVA